jgi:2-alkyl-3-oxoalkanoate reductase
LKVGIVGCGNISLSHVSALKGVPHVTICGVCDRDEQRARLVANAAGGVSIYSDLAELLERERPDAVHILTPPATHAALAIQAMEAGCHVLVEKPMALSVAEADAMIATAKANSVKLSTCHNYLFKPSIVKARELVKSGAIGTPVYVNGYYGLSGEGNAYASAAGQSHWAWRLPGGVFTNFIPHLIYLQQEFMGSQAEVTGVALSQDQNIDQETEMFASLQGEHTAGTLSVSMRTRPYAKFIEIYGTKGIIRADMVSEVCVINRERKLPRLISKVTFNLEKAVQLLFGTAQSAFHVLTGRMKNMPDLQVMTRELYAALEEGREPPITGEDGRRMVEMMEQLWNKTKEQRAMIGTREAPVSQPVVAQTSAEQAFLAAKAGARVLVTGAGGFLGQRLVHALHRAGADVVALVRDKNRVPLGMEKCATIVAGDLSDAHAVTAAMEGVQIVFHCAAITRNNVPWKVHYDSNILGTEHVLKAAKQNGVERVVHVSSVVVYGLAELGSTGNGHSSSNGNGHYHAPMIDETTPLERNPEPIAFYMRSKIAAEEVVSKYIRDEHLPVTIIRPGILYGPGAGRVGRSLAQLGPLYLMFGQGNNALPLTYIDNVVDALLLAATKPDAVGQAYNIVDDPQINVRECATQMAAITGDPLITVPVPTPLLSGAASIFELRRTLTRSEAPPKLSNYVVRSAVRDIRYDTRKAREQLGWQPEVCLDEGLRQTLNRVL